MPILLPNRRKVNGIRSTFPHAINIGVETTRNGSKFSLVRYQDIRSVFEPIDEFKGGGRMAFTLLRCYEKYCCRLYFPMFNNPLERYLLMPF
jgi:hypothetical protein